MTIKRDISVGLILLVYGLAMSFGAVSGGMWASLGLVSSLLLAGVALWETKRFPRPDVTLSLLVAGFITATYLSSLSSVNPDLARHGSLKLLSVLVPLLFLSSPYIRSKGALAFAHADKIVWAALLGGVLLVGMHFVLLAETPVRPVAIAKFNRGLSYYCGILIPLLWFMGAQGKQNREKYVLCGLVAVLFIVTESLAVQLGLVVAAIVYGMARFAPRVTLAGLCAGGFLALFWPFLSTYAYTHYREMASHLPASAYYRLEIWDCLSFRIMERSLLGWGVGTAHQIDHMTPNWASYRYVVDSFAHPHNFVVQLWVETGLLGLALASLLLVWCASLVFKLRQEFRPYAWAAFAYYFVLLFVAYNFWTDSLWAAMALTVFAFAALNQAEIKRLLSQKSDDGRKY